MVDEAVRDGRLAADDVVAVDVGADALDGLAGVLGQGLRPCARGAATISRACDLDVGRLALRAAVGLVDEHPGVGQGEALARGARRPG